MKIIYIHHAERNRNSTEDPQENDITENGVKAAEFIAENMKNIVVEAIYTSPYKRCHRTSTIINKYNNAPIYEESRFNEWEGEKESGKEFLKRNMAAISELVEKYKGTDANIVCVSSGVNITAFVYHFYNIPTEPEIKWIQHALCAPIIFEYENK